MSAHTVWILLTPILILSTIISSPPMINQISSASTSGLSDLLYDRIGFGGDTIGGLHGDVYYVTTLADSGPGSLRYAAERPEPLWIIFKVSGIIKLRSPIRVASYKTIDGRNASITISGNGLILDGVSHVIIAYIRFDSGDGDAIQIINSAHNIWIHHCDFVNWGDGLIDITRGATNITVSWCRFWSHNKVMLIGADPADIMDEAIQVTLHHNFFYETIQRHPRLRFGKVDVYNNYYYRCQSYCIGSTMHGRVLAEANIFEECTTIFQSSLGGDPENGYIKLIGNLFLSSGLCESVNPEKVFIREDYYKAPVEPATEELKSKIIAYAGCPYPANPRIMRRIPDGEKSGHPMYVTDFAIPIGESITLYADIPPPRSISEWVESIEWDFGDGSKGVGKTVEHSYSIPGSYTVRVYIKYRSGGSITLTTTLNVYVRLELIACLILACTIAVSSVMILLKHRRIKAIKSA
ncbi:MAG: PKD domain-containing protein [Candidatus Bathyarchaeia archaeon]|nr:PKD domain-containing protein [Candidatus Bathyarchaeota archaeon]